MQTLIPSQDTTKDDFKGLQKSNNSAEKLSKQSKENNVHEPVKKDLDDNKSEQSTTDQTDKNLQVEKQVVCIKKSDFHTP